MKKLNTILATIILSLTLFTTVQAAVGIPDYLVPKNSGMQGINKAVTEQVKSAAEGEQQNAAIAGVNVILQYVANLLLFVAAPLAVLFIARAGNDYTFAMGDETKVENAKRELTWALLGLVLVMFSYLIVRLAIQPFTHLQTDNDKTLGGGTSTTQQSNSAASTSGTAGTFDFENALKQVEENAKENPNASAKMYDPSNKLGGVNASVVDDGKGNKTYTLDGKSVTRDEFKSGLNNYAAGKK